MANIGMLHGDMYLRHAWRVILQNDINLNADMQQLLDYTTQYLYSINTKRIELASSTKLVEFTPVVNSSTHVVLGFMLNIHSESTGGDIAFEIRHNSELLTSIGYTVKTGWNLITFPYFVPSMGHGKHTIQIFAVGMQGLIVEPKNLNCYLQARSILGTSDLPPTINVFDQYLYRNINVGKVSSTANIDVITPAAANVIMTYNEISANEVTTTVTIELL